ncbi:MAG: porin [Rhodospirillales bacterium]|nr:porin [Rhodospirillales bacterium]
MKKLLLGTSALVAASLFSNGALAQTATTDTPVQFKIGGQYYAGAGAFVQQNDAPGDVAYKRNPISFQDYFLIRFIGSTTFSNGVTAGVFTRLNAFSAPNAPANTSSGFQSSNNTTIKDSYLYLKNTAVWGEFRIGDDSDVRRNVAVGNNAGAANGDGYLGANSASLQWLNTPVYNFTTLNLDGRGTKVAYYSPTIMGFQLSASFTPDKNGGHTYGPGNVGDNSGLTDRITNGLTPSYLNNETAYNYYSVAGQWTGNFGPTKVVGTLGYSSASRKCGVSSGVTIGLGQNATQAQCSILGSDGTQNADPHVYNAGMQVDYGPFELGVNYEQSVGMPGGLFVGAQTATAFNAAGEATTFVQKTNEMVNKQVDLNVSYTVGAIRLGAEWSRGEFEGITGDPNVKRAAIQDEIQVGGAYAVGPGVALIGMLQEALYDANGKYVPLAGGVQNIYAKNSNSTALIFETAIRF